jgi:hypothetical protein
MLVDVFHQVTDSFAAIAQNYGWERPRRIPLNAA